MAMPVKMVAIFIFLFLLFFNNEDLESN